MIYDRIKELCKQRGISVNQLEKELSISRGALCRIDVNKPGGEKMQKLSDFFGVTIEYLLTGKNETQNPTLTERDKREIGRDLDRIMDEIENDIDGPLYYNGTPIDEHSLDLLRKALELGLTELKKENKVKYNPYKNKVKK